MLENNDDFENTDKNGMPNNEENPDLIINNADDSLDDSPETPIDDIFANIPPMPDDYEGIPETPFETPVNEGNPLHGHEGNNDETVTVQPVKFASFDEEKSLSGDASKNLDNLLDIKLQLTVELGRTTLPVKKVLELTRGSIVELDKVAGEPVELYANGKLIAHGEVVVIEDNFGLRITSMSEPENKLNELK